ncbi:MAG: DUF1329 domain-containing protein [Burkholderiales bacterium]|jgi:hypothetical protein|nr:DUF1329 domain-containing protein [Burkholderiales bacterium]MBP6250128.1 DUF1329 domain-containing protein [Leptothrix sp. (in: b-proteobacteria)]MBP7522001.1 DUF1329 domain-containing protein [Leptothrix sp. (in: b-proteobacteria)]
MIKHTVLALAAIGLMSSAAAAVSADEAARLKGELTPFGAEKAGNKDGSIPAWAGGYTTPIPGFKNGGKRADPFAADKPLYQVTARNMAEHADRLTEGVKAMLKKYPDSFRVDVYPTRRTAAAPQWVYDNTARNAVKAELKDLMPAGAYGGIPFPIPKNGAEAMWNHTLRWRGEAWHVAIKGIQGTGDGKHVTTAIASGDFQMPYYFKDGSADKFDGQFWSIRMLTSGPALRAGEGIVGREHLNGDKTQVWVYVTGQRRVRKVPNACCDSPTPASAGVSMFDQTDVFNGRLDRFDWKIVGKKEMLIPYNGNKLLATPEAKALDKHHLASDAMRWELHRVWVIEANVAAGKRHLSPKRRYYLDEDTWIAVLADHWDANGQLWQMGFANPVVMPDLPATTSPQMFGFYDLISGAWYYDSALNDAAEQYKVVPRYADSVFTAESLTAEGVR